MKITLEKFMTLLVGRANGVDEDGKKKGEASPALRNFIDTHDLIGTTRGVPHWKRNEKYYNRGRKTYRQCGNVPGGVRRAMERAQCIVRG